jgi:transposase
VPGAYLVVDWASEAGLEVFCAVLAWSRYRFVRFAHNQTRETTLRLLAECFAELGGVPTQVLTDRMGCLRAGVVANVVVPHSEYVAFAAQYAAAVPPLPSRSPRVTTVYCCPECDVRYLGQQRCADCGVFC